MGKSIKTYFIARLKSNLLLFSQKRQFDPNDLSTPRRSKQTTQNERAQKVVPWMLFTGTRTSMIAKKNKYKLSRKNKYIYIYF